jgi:hypothetical protein
MMTVRTTRPLARRRLAALAASAVLCVLVLSGCTSARSGLGTSDSSCYLALPTASQAVGGHGRFLGVHMFTVGTLRHKAPHLYNDLSTQLHTSQRVCVVAYSGSFRSSSVQSARGKASGKLAVAVSTYPGNHLLGTVLFSHIPLRFSHSHLG